MSENSFTQFALNKELLEVVNQLHFQKPTQIQQKVIPEVLAGRNVIGQSETGSGKTHAFLLPLLNNIDPNKNEVQCVITVPTRELAMQIFEEVRTIIKLAEKEDVWRTRLVIGGVDRERMMRRMNNPPHIIVGTPGRILDMVNNQAVSIYTATSFVIDEADLMLDLGFINEVDQLLVRSKKDIQTLVFSATIPNRLQHFFKKYLFNPVHVKIESGLSPETMEHRLIALRHRNPAKTILEISQMIQPFVALVFANNKESADQLYEELSKGGLNVGIIHGGLTARERRRLVSDLRDLRYQYIVATDLASRGIDIEGVTHVFNAELPKEIDFYVHRVGRTARAGNEGIAISFYTDDDIKLIEQLENNGINFLFSDIRNGEWINRPHWNDRKRRKQTNTSIDREAWNRVKRPKQVKPGYKKRMKQEQEKIKKQLLQKKRRKRRKRR